MENNNNTGKTADVASARNRINRLFAERGDRKLLSIYSVPVVLPLRVLPT